MKLKKISNGSPFQRVVFLGLRSAEPSRQARRAAGIGIDAVAYALLIATIFVVLWVATP